MSWKEFLVGLLKVVIKIAIIAWFHIFITRVMIYFFQLHFVKSYCISVFIAIFLIVLLTVWYIKKEGSLNTFGLNDIHWKIGLWTLMLGISQFIFITVAYGNPIWIPKSEITMWFFLYSFIPVFYVPIVEEIVFRGIFQKHLLKKLAPWLAILITTIVFVLVHFNRIERMLPALMSGISCGIIYYKTEKLIVCILLHSFTNVLGAIARFNFDYTPILQILSFILATGLAVYAIRGFISSTVLNKKTLLSNKNQNH